MAAAPGKKDVAEKSAREIYARLKDLERPEDIQSDYAWVNKAGVSRSFFTNLKDGSDPSVNNLRLVLKAVGSSLPEFFLSEAEGKLIPNPPEEALVAAIRDVLKDGLPRGGVDVRARHLADSVRQLLGLPIDRRAIEDRSAEADREDASQARESTNQA